MDELTLLADLHKAGLRQGPGSPDVTRRAMVLAGLDGSRPLEIADIGCGTGGASLELARMLDARITAVDFLPSFLDVLRQRAQAQGLGRIITLEASMDALPFTDASFDVIWSEGAVYNMGFEAGIAAWKRFLKPGGKLVLSEITWTTAARPQTITDYWTAQYPEIDTASAKLAVLERHGYRPEGYFLLPFCCWQEHYYGPLRERFPAFLDRHGHSPQAAAIVAAEEEEMALYQRYGQFYSYGMYVAAKV
ncbi:class I SAM-dependent methyltransferase [Desulfovibrio piger]|uniref:class I SAM-dependent methyltransferase n=1 Tax=Desulfovibrio piger TaxID=901 RepID=UPI0025A44837|nr:class I SAM-dependent methyltransferase [Desulfovibrio piger]MDM8329917.1 class I SAM-dependent methyltransferase [Desulfovibrio piger]